MNTADGKNTLNEEELDLVLEDLADLLFEKWLAEINSVGSMQNDNDKDST